MNPSAGEPEIPTIYARRRVTDDDPAQASANGNPSAASTGYRAGGRSGPQDPPRAPGFGGQSTGPRAPLPDVFVQYVSSQIGPAQLMADQVRRKHPQWTLRQQMLYVATAHGAKRTAVSALTGGIAGIPFLGAATSVAAAGADEMRSLPHLMRLILAMGYIGHPHTPVHEAAHWVNDILAKAHHPAVAGGQVGHEVAVSTGRRVASRAASSVGSKLALKRFGKIAPLGASAAFAATMSGGEIVRIIGMALQYFGSPVPKA